GPVPLLALGHAGLHLLGAYCVPRAAAEPLGIMAGLEAPGNDGALGRGRRHRHPLPNKPVHPAGRPGRSRLVTAALARRPQRPCFAGPPAAAAGFGGTPPAQQRTPCPGSAAVPAALPSCAWAGSAHPAGACVFHLPPLDPTG